MKRGLNDCTIMGRLGRDPEMRYTPSGKAVVSFSVAVDDDYVTGEGETVSRTEWFNCEAWGKIAENINQYFVQGKPILVEGSIRTDKWETDGVKHYRTKLVVKTFYFLPRDNSANTEAAEEAPPEPDDGEEVNF